MIQAIWHGHAFVEIILEGGSILIDPLISANPMCDITLEEIYQRNILAIIVTHGHSDHIGDSITIAKRTGAQLITVHELALYFQRKHNLQNVVDLNIGGHIELNDYSIKLVNAIHSAMIGDFEGYAQCVGIILKSEGRTIYHAGDTALHMDMKLLGDYENIDLAFLPIGDNYTMGIGDAVIATSFVKPKTVVPMHYNTSEMIESDPSEFAKQVLANSYSNPKVLLPGQAVVLK